MRISRFCTKPASFGCLSMVAEDISSYPELEALHKLIYDDGDTPEAISEHFKVGR